MKPYYDQDGVTIYHADCRTVLPTLPATSAPEVMDLLLTDPPYNVGVQYGLHHDDMTPDDYERWTREWWDAVIPLVRRAIVFCGLANIGLWYRIRKPAAVGCWYKPGAVGDGPIGFQEWEPWLYWGTKLGGSSVIKAHMGGLKAHSGGHPCRKPLPLMSALLQRTRAQTVLDPFAGSGTTLVAAKQLGRRAIGHRDRGALLRDRRQAPRPGRPRLQRRRHHPPDGRRGRADVGRG